MLKVRILALYLPQFHPTPENDEWWGKGFTEWTNVAQARPLFRGHKQPHIPADLGFYDLRLAETREAQAALAKKYGVEGFCYWHYWFGEGKRLLERPFEEVLNSKKPDFPFCLSWANHSWQRKLWNYDGKGDKMLMEQKYPGDQDIIDHFEYVLRAFKDERYIRVDNKPVFGVYAPLAHPNITSFISKWRELALSNGLEGVYFIGHGSIKDREKILAVGFDAFNDTSTLEVLKHISPLKLLLMKVRARLLKHPIVIKYTSAMKYWKKDIYKEENTIPTITPNWDHTPRSHNKGVVLQGSTPALFKKHIKSVFKTIRNKPADKQIVFLKSWNEWGEGNYIEPDIEYGTQYLEALKDVLQETK